MLVREQLLAGQAAAIVEIAVREHTCHLQRDVYEPHECEWVTVEETG